MKIKNEPTIQNRINYEKKLILNKYMNKSLKKKKRKIGKQITKTLQTKYGNENQKIRRIYFVFYFFFSILLIFLSVLSANHVTVL